MDTFEYAQIATAFFSVLIALVALGLAIYEGHSNRKHNRLSLKPSLVMETSTTNIPPTINATIVNAGLGPAVIKNIQFFYHGTELVGDIEYELKAAISNILENFLVESTLVSLMTSGYVFRASSENNLIRIKVLPHESTCIDNMKELLDIIDIRIEYQSFYGEPDAYDSRES
ncbi:hypothetical protein HCU74_02300 [Spongiibacter sp. KMU-166]|uniref:Uncharacterized protein n=1 Tax=Spongiibacter thalassae TaxID=2721624 RepID=A0ABX1GAP9_9GAMM|nr:hypothetical protein [Spongiibacter thalassae]NKI16243.1 hypothetical protein [Spongiibacter thalassae]